MARLSSIQTTQKRKTAVPDGTGNGGKTIIVYHSGIVPQKERIVKMAIKELIVDNFAGGYKPSAALVRVNLPEMCGGHNE